MEAFCFFIYFVLLANLLICTACLSRFGVMTKLQIVTSRMLRFRVQMQNPFLQNSDSFCFSSKSIKLQGTVSFDVTYFTEILTYLSPGFT